MALSWSLDQAMKQIERGAYATQAASFAGIAPPTLTEISARYMADRYKRSIERGCKARVRNILTMTEPPNVLRAMIITQRNYARRFAPALVEQGLFRDALLAINSRACNQAGLPIGQDMPRVKRKQRAQIGVDIGVTPNEHNDESLTKQRVKP